MDRTQVLA